MTGGTHDVAIVGAGPHGLAAAAHCRQLGMDLRHFGVPMEFWQSHMPSGMKLRSSIPASSIVGPTDDYTLSRYQQQRGVTFEDPLAIEEFIGYGHWFQRHAAPAVDTRRVEQITRDGERFHLRLEDGESVRAARVVLALGLRALARIPPVFAGVPGALAAHSVDVGPLTRFRGQRVAVVGGGQSAQESAALLHEGGADVELITRAATLRYLDESPHGIGPYVRFLTSQRVYDLVYPPTDLGVLPTSLAIAYPELYRLLPRRVRDRVSYSVLKPRGARWLIDRLGPVTISTSSTVEAAAPRGGKLELALSDGSRRTVDFALLATGFEADLDRYALLERRLLDAVARSPAGYPRLRNFQTTVPGLYILGALASESLGPITRFVCGTRVFNRLLVPSLRRPRP